MFIKKKENKNIIGKINLFYKLYFFLSLIILVSFLFIFLNTGIWKNSKDNLLNRIHINGLNNYLKIFSIGYQTINYSTKNLDDVNLNISFEKFTINSLLKSVKINSVVPLFIQRELLKGMIKKKFGRILNISSIGIKYGGSKYTFNYSYSKNTLEYFPRYLKNLTKKNILSNILRIGVVNTKLLRKVREKNIKKRVSLIPIKRAANISEVVKTIYSLASEENTYISGETINIAGGE